LLHLTLLLEVEITERPGWLGEDLFERALPFNEKDCMVESLVGESETYGRSGVEVVDDDLEDVEADVEGVVWR